MTHGVKGQGQTAECLKDIYYAGREIGRFPWISRDTADSAAQILEEGNRRRVHEAQSLESDRLKIVRMRKVFGWLPGRCRRCRSAGFPSLRADIWDNVTVRVCPVHLMNVEQRQVATDLQTKPWAVSPPVGCYRLHPPSPFIITQHESWYSIYRPTESGRLSRVDKSQINTIKCYLFMNQTRPITIQMSSPVSIQTHSLSLASSQSWLPLLRPSIPIG